MARHLDLNLLHTLEILLAERNVTHAAARLNTSQPAVSAQLVRLRKMFGDPLLVPGARGMTPTPRALELAPQLSSLIAGFRGLVQPETFDPADAADTLVICASDGVPCRMAGWFGTLPRIAPRLRIGIVPLNGRSAADMESQMASGQIDIAVSLRRAFGDRLHARRLCAERFVCVVRKDHPYVPAAMSARDFAALTHVVVSPLASDFADEVDDVLGQMGLARQVALSVPSFLMAEKILRNSDFAAVMPASFGAAMSKTLRTYALPFALPSVDICMGWHERTHRSAVHRWLRDEIAGIFERGGQWPLGVPQQDVAA